MKKFLSAVLSFVLLLCLALPVCGVQGDVVGYALYTEIVAEINEKPIASYNVDGRTAIMVQDLAQYGFEVVWNQEARATNIWMQEVAQGQDMEDGTEFVPQPPEGAVGTIAYPIYASDIKVYVAGEEKESFNIGGHVMIYLSDLAAFGDVIWHQEEQIAELKTTDDPKSLALNRLEEDLKSSSLSYQFTCYPGPKGTLVVYGQGGTPHGSTCMMLYVDNRGQQTRIDLLLPNYGFGAQYYLQPEGITFDESGDLITFTTPIKETVENGEKDWGNTLCTFHTGTKELVSMVPEFS